MVITDGVRLSERGLRERRGMSPSELEDISLISMVDWLSNAASCCGVCGAGLMPDNKSSKEGGPRISGLEDGCCGCSLKADGCGLSLLNDM